MKPATPQDTFDHMMGAGAFTYSWWTNTKDVTPSGRLMPEQFSKVPEDWAIEITCETGRDDDGTKTATISHKVVMAAARRFLKNRPSYSSRSAIAACAALLLDVSECDFDAGTSDELLQFIVLGEIVFG